MKKDQDIEEEVIDFAYWNTRLLEKKQEFETHDNKKIFCISFEIHEVYYNSKDEPTAWTEKPCYTYFNDYDDFKDTIKHMKDTLKRTVLREEGDQLIDTGKYLKDYKPEELDNTAELIKDSDILGDLDE